MEKEIMEPVFKAMMNPVGQGNFIIASVDNDEWGAGAMVIIPYAGLGSIWVDGGEDLLVRWENEKGEVKEVMIWEVIFIGSFLEWCKDNKIDLRTDGFEEIHLKNLDWATDMRRKD